MQIISHNGDGPSFDIIVNGNIMYAAEGTNVYIYDVSTEAKIRAMNWQNYLARFDANYFIKILKIDRNYLYVLTGRTLGVYDITNPVNPALVATYNHAAPRMDHKGLSISADGNFAYISSFDIGIIVVNISNKSAPSYIGTMILTMAGESNRPQRSIIHNNYLYVGTETLGGTAYKIDISQPLNMVNYPSGNVTPAIRGSFASPNANENVDPPIRVSISSVAISADGRYVLFVEYHNGVWVLDANTMTNVGVPVTVGLHDFNDIKILGGHAYVSERYGGFVTYDVSSLPTLTQIQTIKPAIPGYNEGIFIIPDQSRVFLAASTMGFLVYNNISISAPVELVLVASVAGLDSAAIKGNMLYCGMHNDGVIAYDVSVPTNPVKVAITINTGRNEEITILGNKLFAAADWAQLSVYDISTPGVFLTDTYRFGPAISSVLPSADGQYLYVSEYQLGKLGIYNISDTKHPVIVSETQFNFAGKCVRYGTKYIIAAGASGNRGLHIIDVTNPAAPVMVATWNPGRKTDDVILNGDIAYVGAENDIYSVRIPDIISNPNTPALSHLNWSGVWLVKAFAIDGSNNRLYGAGTTNGGVRVFDITNPAAMAELMGQNVLLPENATDIVLDGNRLWVTDYASGLFGIDTQIVAPTGLNVKSNPSGAKIIIDGLDTTKTTPDTIYGITASQHTLELKLAGYHDYSQTVNIIANQVNSIGPIDLVANPVQGILSVKTLSLSDLLQLPADILVDGVVKGQGDISISLDAGNYNVSFGPVANFITPAPISAAVAAGETTTLQGLFARIVEQVKNNISGAAVGAAAFVSTVVIMKILKGKGKK